MAAQVGPVHAGKSTGRGSAPRVLMVVTRNQRRGAESVAAALADELAQRGLAVRLFSLAPSQGVPALPIDSLGKSPLGMKTLVRLRREIADCDLVVACGSTTLPASVIAGAWTGRPIIYQNIGDPLYWADTTLRRTRVRALLRRVAAVAALTELSATALEDRFGVPPGRITVIRNSRSSTSFHPATPGEKAQARHRLGLPDGELVVAMVGALSFEKRVELAISAVGRMVGPVRLIVAGEGPMRGQLGEHAASVAPGRVSFLGRCADVSMIFGAADAVVLTSASEGQPGVLIEAGMCGLPVVSTDVGYVRDIVIDGETGHLVPAGDVDAIAQELWHALENRRELGTAARQHCKERFDLDRVVDDWLALIGAVLGGGDLVQAQS